MYIPGTDLHKSSHIHNKMIINSDHGEFMVVTWSQPGIVLHQYGEEDLETTCNPSHADPEHREHPTDEESISTEAERSNASAHTSLVLVALHITSPLSQDADIPATKKPRFQELILTTTDKATANTAPNDATVALPAAADANDDPATNTQPHASRSRRANRHWTQKEDGKLTSAVTNAPEKIVDSKRLGRNCRAGSGSIEKSV
jgi:hypothetical protein